MKTKSVVKSSLFIALAFVFTLISIPNGLNGYANLGDTVILISTAFLNPLLSFIVGAFGSALADLSLGYFVYIPASFIIKGLIPVIYFAVSKILSKKIRNRKLTKIIAALCAEIFMVVGYYLFASILYNSFAAPLISLPSDMIQGAIGVIGFVLVSEILERLKVIK